MFSGLIGQQAAKERLGRQAAAGAARHAYLFVGEGGLGKRAFALAFAKALLCTPDGLAGQGVFDAPGAPGAPGALGTHGGAPGGAPSGVDGGSDDNADGGADGAVSPPDAARLPCGECSSCRLFDSGATDDFLLVGASQARSVSVDEIRSVSDWVSTRPTYSSRKACVIADADRMTAQAQNALLKTLEEPPGYAAIILTSARPDALLETVRSRCEAVRFARYSEHECVDILVSCGVPAENARFAARMSAGAPGRIAGRADGLGEYVALCDQAVDLMAGIIYGDDTALLGFIELLEKRKDDFFDIVDMLIACMRDIWLMAMPPHCAASQGAGAASQGAASHGLGTTQCVPGATQCVPGATIVNEDRQEAVAAMAGRVGAARALDCIESLGEVRSSVARNANYTLAANVIALRLASLGSP